MRARRPYRRSRPARSLLPGRRGHARTIVVPAVIAILAVLVLGSTVVRTSANAVSTRRLGLTTQATTADRLKPSECAGISLETVLRGTGSITGGATAELVLAASLVDNINGGAGDDCILGGAGSDIINGGPGTDVCIGGPGTDVFTGCETEIQ
jgi:Ca2+-binding RTX toxin-like protein